MNVQQAKPEHEVAYQDICELMHRHAGNLSAIEVLAIAANMLGKLIALQDQRVISPSDAMKIVEKNIETGNQQVIAELLQSKGKA